MSRVAPAAMLGRLRDLIRSKGAVAPLLSLVLSIGLLLAERYRVTGCFRVGERTGCGSSLHPFGPDALSALPGPLAVAAAVVAGAALIAWSQSRDRISIGAVMHAVASSTFVLTGALPFVFAILVTVFVALSRLGLSPRQARSELLGTLAVTGVAIALAYGAVVAAMYLRGNWIGASMLLLWIYLAYVTAVGLAVGFRFVVGARRCLPMARGIAATFVGAGIAGTLTLLLVPMTLGKGIVFVLPPLLALLALPSGTLAGRLGLDLPWTHAAGITFAAMLLFIPYALATFYVAGALDVAMLGPMLPVPNVWWLPGTSTATR